MANGDIDFTNIEEMVDFGDPLTEENRQRCNEICDHINAEVNLVLKRLGFNLPIASADSNQWLELTKKFGATSLVLDMLGAQNTEEENTRAQRFWDRYLMKLEELYSSGGALLDEDVSGADTVPSRVPILAGEYGDEQMKRYLRFPQRAAADQFTDERAIRQRPTTWSGAIKGF